LRDLDICDFLLWLDLARITFEHDQVGEFAGLKAADLIF